MPIYDVQAPDGKIYSVEAPEGTSQDQIFSFVSSQMGQFNAPKPQEGIGAALTGGFKRFLSSGETALESIINPELAAQRGAERSERIGEQYAPGASLERVKQAYEQKGLFPAAKEVISQIPSALAEQAPQIASTLASARAGAMAGSPFGPMGALAGGIAGASLPSLVQLYGANLERQFEEKTPEISRASALGAAVPGAALEVASQFIPMGRGLIGKLLGPTAEKALTRGSNEAIERAAKESLASSLATGTITGALAEIPTEVAQQMLERYQAGLSLTGDDALKEYGEAAYGAGLVGGPFGAAARGLGRPGARADFERIQREEQARLAVSEEELAQRFPEGTLPGGFRIDREEIGREMAPAGYSIMAEGRDEPLSVVDTAEEAQAKLESLTKIREQEAQNVLAEEQKINAEVEKAKARLEQLEATEQSDTEEYKTLKAEFPTMMEESAQKIADLYEKNNTLNKPLRVEPLGEVERVNEQFKVVDPAGQVVGSFKTLGEAEASIKGVVGSEEYDRKLQAQQVAKQLYQSFVPQMRKFGLGDVGLNIVDRIENGAGGSYLDKLIKVSLEDAAPIQTMRHESLHALKDLGFFTPQQWKALEERAAKEWIKTYLEGEQTEIDGQKMSRLEGYRKLGYSEQDIIEEAIADAFGAYDKGVKPPPGLIAALYNKLKNFFANLGQALRGAGFQSAEDIFQQVERGQLKPAAVEAATAEKFSLPIMRGEEVPKFEAKEGEKPAKKVKPTVDTIGKYFDDQIKEQYGSKLDFTDKASFDRAVKIAGEEIGFQLQKENSGLDWYEDDVKDAFKQTRRLIPELGKTDNRLLFSVMAGIMSPQTTARDNWFIAAKAFQHYVDTKTIPGVNPETNGLWQGGTTSANKKTQLEFLNRMVEDMGQKKALEWLFTDHPVKEINEFRSKYGNIKSGIDGKLTDMRPGLYAFGPKVGPFVANLNGIHDVTVDKWMTRTFNRYFGTMLGPDGKIVDAPTEPQRRAIKALINEVAKNAGIKPYQAQSLLWFYEQQLFTKMGVLSPSYGFSDGAKRFVESGGRGRAPGVGGAPEAAEGKLSIKRGVLAEVAPNPDHIAADKWREMTPAERLDATKAVANKVITPIFGELGLKGYSFDFSSGKFEGEVNPNIIIKAPKDATIEELDEVARVVGYVLDQKSMVTFDEENTTSGSQAGFIKVVVPKDMSPDQLTGLREHIAREVPQASGDTLRDGELVYGNFSAYDDSVDTLTNDEYHQALVSAVGSFDYDGTIRVSLPDVFHSDLIEPETRSGYLEGTRYGEGRDIQGKEGADVRRQGRRRIENLAEQAIVLRDRWIDARGAARLGGRERTDAQSFGEPTAEYGSQRADAVSAVGVHFSKQFRPQLSSEFYGSGLRGMESERLSKRENSDIRNRLYFYVDTGKGIRPEAGVGGVPHVIKLNNLYDTDADPLKIVKTNRGATSEERASNLERKIKDAGFDGMLVRDPILPQGYAILYGKHNIKTDGKLSLKRTSTPAFKEWFGDSKITKNGEPMVMYHGLAKDTTDFTRKTARGAPIFLTDDPEFAQRFAADSYLQVAAHPEKYLTKEQLKDGEKKAISAIRKDYGKDTLGKEMIDSIRDGSPTAEAREYLQKEYVNLLPAGPHIMPLYVRAENPFDYQNSRHIDRLKEEVELDDDLWRSVREGDWDVIESQEVQDAIQMAGFDSFYVKEHGRKNLAVYNPNQVKSATGNIGTFDLKNPDVRYSLRNVAFPTVKEARDAAEQQPVPDTEEFKQYIAGSQWLDEDGKAKKFYHATTGDFFEFRDGAVYLSETAEESKKWGRLAEDRLREQIYKALNKAEKLPVFQQAVNKAVEAGKITEAEGVEFMRDVKRSVPDFGKYDAIKSEMDDALLALSPNRMKIMPLYARAMTPFDFRNKEHVERVVDYITRRQEFDRSVGEVAKEINEKIGGAPTTNTENILRGLKGLLVQGYEKTITDPMVQHAIRRLGFDGYAVRRNRQSPISYAVYQPKQLKSITGNDGQFSLETKDVRYSLKKVRYTDDRFDKLWNESMYTQSDAENKTKGYLAFVNPMDFVKATASPDTFESLLQEREPLDIDRLKKYDQVPYLTVSEKDGEWKITGHEGRHRMMALHDAGYDEIPVYIHLRSDNAKSLSGKFLQSQYKDSVNPLLFVRDIEPLSYSNQDEARAKFTRQDSKPTKYSLPNLSAATKARMNQVTPQRYTPTWQERVIGAFKQDYTGLRQRFLNRYESLAAFDRRLREKIKAAGGPDLLADQSAEFAALQSDLSAGVAASAMGIGDRQGGVPVYRNGVTTIDTSVKGLVEALAPLAKQGDPEIYQRYQFWAGWKRGRRLLREGKEQVYTLADDKIAREIEQAHPEFIQVQKDLVAFNNGIVNFAVQTGVLSRERAQVYTQYADYIPFYRQLDLDKTIGPNPFTGISGIKGPKKIKGGDSPLGDFMENMVRNTQSMINAGMKNAAAQRATKVALQLKEVQRLNAPSAGVGVDVYTQLENGQLVYYRAGDNLFIEALKSLNMPDLPFMGLLSAPANALRGLVTKDPGFMFANLLRDSLSAYVTSGQNITPVVGTMVNFGKALSGKDKNLQALFNAGVIGGYEFSQNIQQSGKSLAADLNKKAGKDATLLRPFKSLWEGLEKGTTASDAATRMAVYERVMQETGGNEAEAISRALEVMNFNRKGNSVLIRIATAALPFFNARLQGLDLFYRASTGRMDTQDAQEIKRKFWTRGMTMAALSVMYYLTVAGDDEYEKQEEETKDNNWIFPSLGIRIPIPFEVGTLFKTMPERITAYLMGNDTGKDLSESTIRALANTFAFNPIPQTFKPLIEVATNYNFFTMRAIVGQGMQDVAPQFQIGPGTSKTAEWIGEKLGMSPMKIDQLIKGYTGTMGGYVIDVVDAISNEFADVPKASKRFEQMPIIKRFVLDPEARGSVTQFYELQKSVDTFVRTSNLLEKTARPEEYAKYVEENLGMLAAKDYVQETEKVMKELRDMKRTISSLDMPPDEKRDLLLDLGRAETNLTANIKTIKKAVSELK